MTCRVLSSIDSTVSMFVDVEVDDDEDDDVDDVDDDNDNNDEEDEGV